MKPLKPILTFLILYFSLQGALHAQWQKTNLPDSVGRTNSIYIWENNIFAATENAGVWMSADNGDTWAAKNNGITATEVRAFTTLGNNVFAGAWGGVFISADTGNTWTPVNNGLSGTALVVFSLAVMDSIIFAGTQDSGIYVSTDMGNSWTASNNGTSPGQKTALAFAIKDSYLFVSNNGLYRSADTGSSWTLVNGAFGPNSFTVSGDNIYAGATALEGIIFSADNGSNWAAINAGLTGLSVRALTTSGNYVFTGTNWDGIFMLLNGDTVWTDINDGVINNYIISSLAANDSFLFAGTWGNCIWRRPLSEIIVGVKGLKKNEITVSVYPNPFGNTVTIEIQNATVRAGKQEFKIYNNTGKLVKRVKVQHSTFTVDKENLPDGMYFYQLIRQKEIISTGKLVIQNPK